MDRKGLRIAAPAPYDVQAMNGGATPATGQRILALWARWGQTVLWLAVAFMVVAAAQRLADGLSVLVWRTSGSGRPQPRGGTDLWIVYEHLQRWAAGERALDGATLPPASYPILWPLIGWLPFSTVRWVWAVTSLVALGWLAALLLRESRGETRAERCFIALVPFAMYSARATIWWGQFILHLLPPLLAGVLLLRRGRPAWSRDLLAVVLLLAALVKPSVSAPFMLLLLVGSRLRPAVLLGVGYAGLTMLAAWQTEGPRLVVNRWLATATTEAAKQATRHGSHGNVHTWLGAVGLEPWSTVASVLLLAALAWWLHQQRRGDLWILLGVSALVARMWTYHRPYDDMLIVVPILALFRLARRSRPSGKPDLAAGILLAVAWASAMAPARLFLRSPWLVSFKTGQTVAWLAMLGFLIHRARDRPDLSA